MLGEVIHGRYRLLSQIGEGGHGVVYRAEQLGMSRHVALKLMQPTRLEAGQLDRFLREAEIAQRLNHPNTVRLLDFGVHRGELPFLVFELLEGRSLAQLSRAEGPLPPARVAHIAAQVARALIEAHQAGIIHRDIKPANVFICPIAGDPDFTKLLDFGIAKSLRANTKALTAQGEILGTPSYMSPEQIEARPVGPPSDVYSLGLVMAEMLTGRRVFTGSAIDVCLQQVSPSPAPLPPEVTASPLGPAIARAVAKRVEQRYSSAAELLAAIEAAMAQPVVSGTPPALAPTVVSPSAPYSTIAAAKPSYLLHIVLAGVALALLGALIVGVWMLVSSP